MHYLEYFHLEINECLTNPCHTQATCTDTKESFTCTCNVGYAGDGRAQCDGEKIFHPISPIYTSFIKNIRAKRSIKILGHL